VRIVKEKMKLKNKDRTTINEFTKQYLDPSFKVSWNHIIPVKTDGRTHNNMVYEICMYLLENNIPFANQVRMKSGYKPDIICPTFHTPIIEVRDSETEKKTLIKMKRVPKELQKKIIYVDCCNEALEQLWIDMFGSLKMKWKNVKIKQEFKSELIL